VKKILGGGGPIPALAGRTSPAEKAHKIDKEQTIATVRRKRDVGELYAYNALPFVALIIGAGLGEVYRRAWRLRWTASAVVIGTALYLAANILAIHEKGGMLREEGERARRMIGAIKPVIRSLPDGAELILLNPPGAPPDYSVYRQKGFDVFEWGTNIFEVVTGRADVRYRLADTLPPPSSRPRVVLTLHGDSVVPYHERPSIDR